MYSIDLLKNGAIIIKRGITLTYHKNSHLDYLSDHPSLVSYLGPLTSLNLMDCQHPATEDDNYLHVYATLHHTFFTHCQSNLCKFIAQIHVYDILERIYKSAFSLFPY